MRYREFSKYFSKQRLLILLISLSMILNVPFTASGTILAGASSNSLNTTFDISIGLNGTDINTNTIYDSKLIDLGGNLNINYGAKLVINNSQIFVNNSQSIPIFTQFSIIANNGSTLIIQNSEITINGSLRVLYEIKSMFNSTLLLDNVSLSYGGGTYIPTVLIESNNSTINNCNFYDYLDYTYAVSYSNVFNGTFSNNYVGLNSGYGMLISQSDSIIVSNNTFKQLTSSSPNLLIFDGLTNLMMVNNSFYTYSGNVFDFTQKTASQITVFQNNYRFLRNSTTGLYNKGKVILLGNNTLENVNSLYDTYLIMNPSFEVTMKNDSFYELIIAFYQFSPISYTSDIENSTINFLSFYDMSNILVNNSTIMNYITSIGNSNAILTQNRIFGTVHSVLNGQIHAYLNYFGINAAFSQYNTLNTVYMDNGTYGNYFEKYSPGLIDKNGDGIADSPVTIYSNSYWQNIVANQVLLEKNITVYLNKIDEFKPYIVLNAVNQVFDFNSTSNYNLNFNVTATDVSGIQSVTGNISFSNGTLFKSLSIPFVTSGIETQAYISLGLIPINASFLITLQASDTFGNSVSIQKSVSIETFYSIVITPEPSTTTTTSTSSSSGSTISSQASSTSSQASSISSQASSTTSNTNTTPVDTVSVIFALIMFSFLVNRNFNERKKKEL